MWSDSLVAPLQVMELNSILALASWNDTFNS